MEALKLDRNLWAADFNLGCLRLEQTNFSGAVDYLNTYTASHPKDVNGFLLLGRARLQLAMDHSSPEANRRVQLENSKLDYEYVEKLHSNAEACNALGVIELQHRNPSVESVRTAMDYFQRAMQREPHYPPALLNQAIVLQRYLNEPRKALEKYREYAALQPAPPLANEVQKLADQLDVDLRITFVKHGAENPAPSNATPANSLPPSQTVPPAEGPAPKPATAAATENPGASLRVSQPPANPPPAVRPPPQSPRPCSLHRLLSPG